MLKPTGPKNRSKPKSAHLTAKVHNLFLARWLLACFSAALLDCFPELSPIFHKTSGYAPDCNGEAVHPPSHSTDTTNIVFVWPASSTSIWEMRRKLSQAYIWFWYTNGNPVKPGRNCCLLTKHRKYEAGTSIDLMLHRQPASGSSYIG